MNTNKPAQAKNTFSKTIALILGLILPLSLFFSAVLMITAGIRMDFIDDLKTKDYFQSHTFSSDFYSTASDILQGISAREILDRADENTYIDLGELYNETSLSFKNTTGLAYSIKDLQDFSKQDIVSDDDWIVLNLTTPENDTKYMYYSDFVKAIEDGSLKLNPVSDMLKAEDISQSDWEQRILNSLKAQYAADGIRSQEPLKSITDQNGNVVYTDVSDNLDVPIWKIPCAPDGYDSLLDYMNSTSSRTRNFKGSLSDAFNELQDALSLIPHWQSRSDVLDQYSKDSSNIRYAYANNAPKTLYTNTDATYLSDLTKIPGYTDKNPYVQIQINDTDGTNTDNQACKTSLKSSQGIKNSEWISLLRSSTYDENCSFLIWIDDTSLPFSDSIQTARDNFNRYRTLFIPAAVSFAISFLLLIFVLVWLTVHAGRKDSDDELHLNAFDRLYTEAAAALVCIPALGVLTIGLNLGYSTYNDIGEAVIIGVTIFLITALFWIGYLSLIRRIKAHTLWKNSLLRRCLKLPGILLKKAEHLLLFFSRNTISRIRMMLALGLFLFLQFFFSAMSSETSSVLLILLLFILDLGAFFWFYRMALGREILLDGLKRITDGELSYKIPEEKLQGDQKEIAEYINRIGDGLDAAVEKSLKDERMKTELITNVSHDLKTPLTSIINYVDLLKRKNFTDPEVINYLEILDSKAHRLKSLTEDVVEASKASTGNLSLEMADLNLVEMLYQVMGEFEERLSEHHLMLMTHFPDTPAIIYADGRRMWRVLENLFGNILKYAMENTRVYAEVLVDDSTVNFTLKNISAQPLNIPAEELTERFIRGDVARNTEGSGLGLSIAKSLTQLQGGSFDLYLDGDLFKVCLKFPLKKPLA